MSVTIRLEGSKELQAALRDMSDDIRAQVGLVVRDVANDLKADVVLSIQQGPTSGRYYKRGNVTHRASAPGETPASDTGALMGSIYAERIADLTYSVGSGLAYAAYLEYGTSRMAARPYFRPAVERIRPIFNDLLEQAVGRATR